MGAGQDWDLIVTMDDATNAHYSMFCCDEEGTRSSFQGVRDIIEGRGLFCSLHTDRGSHYWTTRAADGNVDTVNLTQFGRAMGQLGSDDPGLFAGGRSERVFSTHRDRLKELALAGITEMKAANRYLTETCLPAHNAEFTQPPPADGLAFVACRDIAVPDDILCGRFERTVRKDNCVHFEGRVLQIPADRHRCHYVKARVRILRYTDGSLSIHHGPREPSNDQSKSRQSICYRTGHFYLLLIDKPG